jgi:hypothetical protein
MITLKRWLRPTHDLVSPETRKLTEELTWIAFDSNVLKNDHRRPGLQHAVLLFEPLEHKMETEVKVKVWTRKMGWLGRLILSLFITEGGANSAARQPRKGTKSFA